MKKYILLLLFLGLIFWPVSSQDSKQEPLNLSVKTDFSTYEAQDPRIPLYTRLSPEPLAAFLPSPDYGKIFPYLGKVSRYYSNRMPSEQRFDSKFYGFVDHTGQIIVDPVYYDIELLVNESDGTLLPYWVVTEEFIAPETDYPSYRKALVSIDGSFATDFSYSDFEGHSDCIIAIGLESCTFDVLDPEGNILFTSADLSVTYPVYSLCYCDNGLFLLSLWDYPDLPYYFMDWEGNLLFGPFDQAKPFSCGWAPIRRSDGSYTYMDATGKFMARAFLSVSDFEDGYALARTAQHTEILKQDGSILFTVADRPSSWIVEDDGIILYYWERPTQLYSFEGNILLEFTDMRAIHGTSVYLSHEDPSAPYLYHLGLDKTLYLPPLGKKTTLFLHHPLRSPFIILMYRDEKQNRDTYYIYSPELELLSVEYHDRPLLLWEKTGEEQSYCLALSTTDGNWLYDPQGEPYVLCPIEDFRTGSIYDEGYLSLTDDFCTRIYDPQGTLIFSYPLLENMDD